MTTTDEIAELRERVDRLTQHMQRLDAELATEREPIRYGHNNRNNRQHAEENEDDLWRMKSH